MDKKPITISSNDWHLNPSNIEIIKDLIKQKCEYAVKFKVNKIFVLGDIFESRIAQRQETLNAFGEILDIIEGYGLTLVLIPGNHDKTVYTSKESFLDPFKHHKALFLVRLTGGIPFKESDMMIQLIPFFSEEQWLKAFNDLEDYNSEHPSPKFRILMSHIAVDGSVNNDGSKISSHIKPSMFKNYYKVFLGHYHDYQKIGENIYHLPSIRQNNFGEDQDKGFTILYSDGSHEIVNSEFKKFIKVNIDLDTMTSKIIDGEFKKYSDSKDNVRFVFTGSDQKLKALKKEKFTSFGIDVKTKSKVIEETVINEGNTEVVQFSLSKIKDKFKEFCKEEGIDYEFGKKYL